MSVTVLDSLEIFYSINPWFPKYCTTFYTTSHIAIYLIYAFSYHHEIFCTTYLHPSDQLRA